MYRLTRSHTLLATMLVMLFLFFAAQGCFAQASVTRFVMDPQDNSRFWLIDWRDVQTIRLLPNVVYTHQLGHKQNLLPNAIIALYADTTKNYKIEFKLVEVGLTAPPPPLVPIFKETIDNTAFVYSLKNPTPNTLSGTSWSLFHSVSGAAWPDVFHGTTCAFSSAINTFAEITFTGKRAVIFGEKSDNKGIAAVSVNGQAETMVDLYAATSANNTQAIFDTGVLPQGTHTVKFRVTGNRNPAAASTGLFGIVLLDKADVYE